MSCQEIEELILAFFLRSWESTRSTSLKNSWTKPLTHLVLEYSKSPLDRFDICDEKYLKITNNGQTIQPFEPVSKCKLYIAMNKTQLIKGQKNSWNVKFENGSTCLRCVGIITTNKIDQIDTTPANYLKLPENKYSFYYCGFHGSIIKISGRDYSAVSGANVWDLGEIIRVEVDRKEETVRFSNQKSPKGKCEISENLRNFSWFSFVGICCNNKFMSKNAKMSFVKDF